MQSIFMILDLFDRLSQAILSEQKCEKKIMLIEKHKYDQFSDTKVASLFPFHILSYKYARKSVKTKQYIAQT